MISASDTLLGRLHIAKGARVFDVGFGTSRELLVLSNIVGDSGSVFGVERSRRLVRKTARELHSKSNVRTSLGDAHSFAAPDNSVDIVLFKGILHEVRDPNIALLEAKRVCDNEGRIMILDFSPFPGLWLRRSNFRWKISRPWRLLASAPDIHPGFSREGIRSFFRHSGLVEDLFEDNFAPARFYGHPVPMFLSASTAHK